MSHSYNKIWNHAIWATKNRQPMIAVNIEKNIHQFLHEQLLALGCPVRIINGMADHVHCLFLLQPEKAIADVIKQIKGSSSHYINHNNLTDEKFAWQKGYASFSVSESVLDRVFHYIKNQKAHHSKNTFLNEYEAFLKLHGLEQP